MPATRIHVAQLIHDDYEARGSLINGSDSEASSALARYRAAAADFPDAVAAVETRREGTSQLSLDALRCMDAAGWADAALREDPTALEDFPRWARHLRGATVGRLDLLRGYLNPPLPDSPTPAAMLAARRIISVAARFGLVRGEIQIPDAPISHARMSQIADLLAAAAEDRVSGGRVPPPEARGATDENPGDKEANGGRRRGRLPKDDAGARRAHLLATIREHPSLTDDVGKLAGMIDVSESTVRRWIEDEQRKYRESRAARPAKRDEE